MNTHANFTMIPLSLIDLSPANVRKTAPRNIESLAASIRVVGLLNNLVVTPKDDGRYDCVAGGRRWRALNVLVTEGVCQGDELIPCNVREMDDLTSVSLTENEQRVDMAAADRLEAYTKMVAEGMTIESIADAFGVGTKDVERYLAMDRAAPALKDLLRTGEINTDQLAALCSNPDHDAQVDGWETSHYKDPKSLRAHVTSQEIPASDNRVAFVGGVSAYRARGGAVLDDLFSATTDAGFIMDAALLERLVLEKLEAKADEVRAEGWAWVLVSPEFDTDEYHRCGNATPLSDDMSPEHKAAIAALEAEEEALEAELEALQDGDGEYTDAEEARYDEITERRDAIEADIREVRDTARVFSGDVKAYAGAIIGLSNGALRVARGQVRAQDRKQIVEAGESVRGGRETPKPGRKEGGLSDALTRSLRCHRNIAVQLETAKNVRVAKVLMGVWAHKQIVGRFDRSEVPSDFVLGGHGVRSMTGSQGEDVKARAMDFQLYGDTLVAGIKGKGDQVWDAIAAMDDVWIDKLIAYAVGLSVSVDDGSKGMTGKLLAALDFDMADHFEATADVYLERVSKKEMVEALVEAGKASDKDGLLAQKKGELVAIATERLKGTRWVPALIRTPTAKKGTTPKAAKGAKVTKKAAPVVKGGVKGSATTQATA